MAARDIVSIRRASLDDYEAISRLYELVDALHAKGRPDAFKDPGGRSREFLAECLGAKDSAMFVAEAEGVVVALAYVTLGRPPNDVFHRPRVFAYLEELVVSPAHRRKGIATVLVDEVEDWASAQRVDAVELTVWEFNEDALRFYESLGYATSYRRMFKLPNK
jgi:ribosomal protein S18 acetylase RimI-like enzyme